MRINATSWLFIFCSADLQSPLSSVEVAFIHTLKCNFPQDIHLEYWLDAETGRFKMNDNFVLFGVGKRDCVGRQVAMLSLYAMFALFLQQYKFVAPNNDPDAIDIQRKWGLVWEVQPAGINVELRE